MLKKVMLIDDETSILQSLKRLLRVVPCTYSGKTFELEIEAFSSAKEALERVRTESFDLFLCDYRMPELDGISFLQAAKEVQPDAWIRCCAQSTKSASIASSANPGTITSLSQRWHSLSRIASCFLRIAGWRI
jgi:CheY-like chemotaxis protein